MNQTLNHFLGLYFSTAGSSIIMNLYLNERYHINSKKNCMKNLKYRKGLHSSTKKIIRSIDIDHVFDNLDSFLWSLVPFYNIFYTCDSIDKDYEFSNYAKECYEKIIEEANENEDHIRKQNIILLRSLKDSLSVLPEDINLNDNKARLSSIETKKILKRNHLNYKNEFKKIDEGE